MFTSLLPHGSRYAVVKPYVASTCDDESRAGGVDTMPPARPPTRPHVPIYSFIPVFFTPSSGVPSRSTSTPIFRICFSVTPYAISTYGCRYPIFTLPSGVFLTPRRVSTYVRVCVPLQSALFPLGRLLACDGTHCAFCVTLCAKR